MSSGPPSLSVGNLIEILPGTTEEDPKKIQFAKEVILFAFSDINNDVKDIAAYISTRFSENFNQQWNCSVCEWDKGGLHIYTSSSIDIKYNNYKIIIWIC